MAETSILYGIQEKDFKNFFFGRGVWGQGGEFAFQKNHLYFLSHKCSIVQTRAITMFSSLVQGGSNALFFPNLGHKINNG
jgi:hypothetical protein